MATKSKTARGGARPGAGRKRDRVKLEIETLIAQAVTKADWVQLIKKLVAMGKTGDVKAIKILLEYAYGKPKQMVEHSTPEDEPMMIEVVYVHQPPPARSSIED